MFLIERHQTDSLVRKRDNRYKKLVANHKNK